MNSYIADAQEAYGRSLDTLVNAPDTVKKVGKRKRLEAELVACSEEKKQATLLSPSWLKAVGRMSIASFQHARNQTEIMKLTRTARAGLNSTASHLLAQTKPIDSERQKFISEVEKEPNPFAPYYNSFANLIAYIDQAIYASYHAKDVITQIQSAKATQYVTRNAQGKLGQFIHSGGQATETHGQIMLGEALGTAKFKIAVAYDEAAKLSGERCLANVDNLSASNVALTYSARTFLDKGTLGTIAKFANIYSLEALRGNLWQAINNLSELRRQAYYPIQAFHHFENERSRRIDNYIDQTKKRLLNERVNGKTLSEMCSEAVSDIQGKGFGWTTQYYKRAITGLVAGLGLAFSAAAYEAYSYLDTQETSQAAAGSSETQETLEPDTAHLSVR